LPIVRAAEMGFARVTENESGFEGARIGLELFALYAFDVELNCTCAAVHCGIVILYAGGHADHLSFDVFCNDEKFFFTVIATRERVERAAYGDVERGRAAESGTRRRTALGRERKTARRAEELHQSHKQLQIGVVA